MNTNTGDQEHQIAVFVDLDNIAIGVKEAKIDKLDIVKILDRLVEKGKITVKRAPFGFGAAP